MRVPLATKPIRRDADNELYDHGCDLVATAAAIRRAAGAQEAARAVPAVLGCMEAALRELTWAAAALEQTSNDQLETARDHPSARTRAIAERMQRGFANLQQALSDGESASAAARSLAGRALAPFESAWPERKRRSSTA